MHTITDAFCLILLVENIFNCSLLLKLGERDGIMRSIVVSKLCYRAMMVEFEHCGIAHKNNQRAKKWIPGVSQTSSCVAVMINKHTKCKSATH